MAETYPTLFHMAADASWPQIKRHGLLSTTALLDLFEVSGADRDAIESSHRRESMPIVHPVHGRAVVRDQKPMDDRGLERALEDGLTPIDWYRVLNDKVFFWVRRERLEVMMNARAYKKQPKVVLQLATAELLSAYSSRVLLAPMNTGCTKPMPHPRGRDTFLPLGKYPFERLKKKKRRDAVVELAVTGGVPDVRKFATRVDEFDAKGSSRCIYVR